MDEPEFTLQLVEMANTQRPRFEGRSKKEQTKILRQTITEAEVVFGVYQDPDEPGGVGKHLIKGAGKIQMIAHAGVLADLRVTAIPCSCLEEAVAMGQVFGDSRPERAN